MEKDIESYLRKRVKAAGGLALKLVCPGCTGVPDRLILLPGGNHIVWFGLTWSLELYQQANARIYRQGVKGERVTITHLVAEGTIDEDVMRALAGKATRQDALLEAVKARIKKYQEGGNA